MSKTRTREAGSVHLKQAYILSKQMGDPQFVTDVQCIGIGAIKRPYENYKNKVFKKAGVPELAKNYSLELGWNYTVISARRKGVGRKIMEAII